jgi:hypothetical protein
MISFEVLSSIPMRVGNFRGALSWILSDLYGGISNTGQLPLRWTEAQNSDVYGSMSIGVGTLG